MAILKSIWTAPGPPKLKNYSFIKGKQMFLKIYSMLPGSSRGLFWSPKCYPNLRRNRKKTA